MYTWTDVVRHAEQETRFRFDYVESSFWIEFWFSAQRLPSPPDSDEPEEVLLFLQFQRESDVQPSKNIVLSHVPFMANLFQMWFGPRPSVSESRTWFLQPAFWQELLEGPIEKLEDYFRACFSFHEDYESAKDSFEKGAQSSRRSIRSHVRTSYSIRRKRQKNILQRKLDRIVGAQKVQRQRMTFWVVGEHEIRPWVGPMVRVRRVGTTKGVGMTFSTLIEFLNLSLVEPEKKAGHGKPKSS